MKIEWEHIESSHEGELCYRAQVYGGWLVRVIYDSADEYVTDTLTFVPDKFHQWSD